MATESLENRFIHLANNAVSAKSTDFHETGIKGNMWRKQDFVAFLSSLSASQCTATRDSQDHQQKHRGEERWSCIEKQMRSIIQSCFSCVQTMVEVRLSLSFSLSLSSRLCHLTWLLHSESRSLIRAIRLRLPSRRPLECLPARSELKSFHGLFHSCHEDACSRSSERISGMPLRRKVQAR